MIAFKRPVLYLDELDKIHNSDIKDYVIIDQIIKDNFGYLFKKSDFDKIDIIIDNSEYKFKKITN